MSSVKYSPQDLKHLLVAEVCAEKARQGRESTIDADTTALLHGLAVVLAAELNKLNQTATEAGHPHVNYRPVTGGCRDI